MNAVDLEECCRRWNGSSEGFAQVISTAVHSLGLYQRELANQFQVADSTVSRWASGIARPHPRLQKIIVASILRRAQRSIGVQKIIRARFLKHSTALKVQGENRHSSTS